MPAVARMYSGVSLCLSFGMKDSTYTSSFLMCSLASAGLSSYDERPGHGRANEKNIYSLLTKQLHKKYIHEKTKNKITTPKQLPNYFFH